MDTPLITLTQYAVLITGLLYLTTGILVRLLRPKRFYLVRHGQSLLNQQHVRQGPEGALSPKGRDQAAQSGRFLAQFPIEQILASPYDRTRETAAVIQSFVRVPVAYSLLLAERRNPSEVVDKHYDDPTVVRISDLIDHAYHDDDFRYSDEENFLDLRARAHDCLAMLERQRAHEVCVVTHSFFLKMLVAYLLYRENLHARDYVKLSFFNAADNASVTICEYRPWRRFSATRGWRIIVYNLHADAVTPETVPAPRAEPVLRTGETSR